MMLRIGRFAAVTTMVLVVILATSASARYTYGPWPDNTPSPQYVNIAPLPGAGIALDSTGGPDGAGAFQVNIPVAYTPRMGFVSVSMYKGRHGNHDGGETDNGSGIFALGFFNKPALYASCFQVSSILSESKCLSFQLAASEESERMPALAVGVQDLLEKEARMKSYYFVATKSLPVGSKRVYVTAGYGGGRFLECPFGGISVPVNDSVNAALEWDGYQINTGAGWRPGGRKGWLTLLAAHNGKAGWLFGGAVAFRLGEPRH